MNDFYFTGDDYRYRFEHGAKIRFIKLLREQFNSGVRVSNRVLKWDTVIEEKTNELARYLNGRNTKLHFIQPAPILDWTDDRAIRDAILHLTQKEARRRRIGKSTLHNLRDRARDQRPFLVYRKVRERITK